MKRWLKKDYAGWIAVAVLFLLWRQFGPGLPGDTVRSHDRIAEAFARQQSGIMVEFDARVRRLLPDDTEGNPHQRFIVELDNGHSLLVAHNLKLAARVPLAVYDLLAIRGEYEWNAQGGVVHWTHRDPGAGVKHGWIEHKGVRYE
ncbi:DUF3465 domain-containing protein [Elongatibacter sediminis]|uniref:DUF3465 domain-containing protein n=1 Tax=Elongatibacter sediminis TaxID=3119006 RepID=A0AAW9RG78_9GAMM